MFTTVSNTTLEKKILKCPLLAPSSHYLLFLQQNLKLLDFESKVLADFFDLPLDIILEAPSLTPVLHHHAVGCLVSDEKGGSLHPLEGELEVVMQVVQVDKKVPEPPSNTLEHQSITKLGGQGDKVDSHPLVELLVLHLEQFHRRLPHLEDLTFWKDISDPKIVLNNMIMHGLVFTRRQSYLYIESRVHQNVKKLSEFQSNLM